MQNLYIIILKTYLEIVSFKNYQLKIDFNE